MDEKHNARMHLRAEVERRMEGRMPAHDLSHVDRVASLAARIAEAEGADVDVCVTAALLHELVNLAKDHPDSSRSGDLCAIEAAVVLGVRGHDAIFIEAVVAAIRDHAFSKGASPPSLEARILQDADRLDAIGAVGIARCFATTTEMRRPFFATSDPFCKNRPPEDKRFGLDHFYRKLLRIDAGLHTVAARKLAVSRVSAMRAFLASLEDELT